MNISRKRYISKLVLLIIQVLLIGTGTVMLFNGNNDGIYYVLASSSCLIYLGVIELIWSRGNK